MQNKAQLAIDVDGMLFKKSKSNFWFTLARWTLGLILIASSISKNLNPQDFAQVVFNYQILPGYLVNLVAIILPWLELILGMLLVTGKWVPGSVVTGNILLMVFLAALFFNMFRGLDVSCGCFTTDPDAGPANISTILRDLIILGVALFCFFMVFFKKGHSR